MEKRHVVDPVQSVLRNAQEQRGLILVIEDDATFAKMLTHLFTANGFEVIVARDGEEGLVLARDKRPDVIVTDWMMPRLDGMEFCAAARLDAELRAVYIILLSNRHDTDEKIRGLESGADDYVAKTVANEELVARVESGMRIRLLQRALMNQATVDGLTGLSNRTHFFDRFRGELERSRRHGQPLTMAMIDLDGLKRFNDENGHLCGDAAIKHMARFLTLGCRANDLVARWGGDEFAVLFSAADAEGVTTIMERLQEEIRQAPFTFEGRDFRVDFSFGVAECDPSRSSNPETYVKEADAGLYAMKHARHAESR